MKIRFANENDIDGIVRLSRFMPNVVLAANDNLLKDILIRLIRRNSIFVVAEDNGGLVGMIGFVRDDKLKNIVDFKMIIKAALLRYGSPLKLAERYLNSRKIKNLIHDSYHGFVVAVDPRYRRKDIATLMWKKARGRMRGKVTLLIDSKNRASRLFAEKRIKAEKIKEVPELFERGKTWILYERKL